MKLQISPALFSEGPGNSSGLLPRWMPSSQAAPSRYRFAALLKGTSAGSEAAPFKPPVVPQPLLTGPYLTLSSNAAVPKQSPANCALAEPCSSLHIQKSLSNISIYFSESCRCPLLFIFNKTEVHLHGSVIVGNRTHHRRLSETQLIDSFCFTGHMKTH